MKNFKFVAVASVLLTSSLIGQSAPDSDEGEHSYRPSLQLQVKAEEKAESKKTALEILDKLLSPFEDMTEHALEQNTQGVENGYKNIQKLKTSKLLKESIRIAAYQEVLADIAKIQTLIKTQNYSDIALVSTSIFKTIVNNFNYSEYVVNQIYMENLDGVGFELLSHLSKKDTNYMILQNILDEAQKEWVFLRDNLEDENSIDAFDLLFKALSHAIMNHDNEMIKTLASMDLTLIDMIEKQLQLH